MTEKTALVISYKDRPRRVVVCESTVVAAEHAFAYLNEEGIPYSRQELTDILNVHGHQDYWDRHLIKHSLEIVTTEVY